MTSLWYYFMTSIFRDQFHPFDQYDIHCPGDPLVGEEFEPLSEKNVPPPLLPKSAPG